MYGSLNLPPRKQAYIDRVRGEFHSSKSSTLLDRVMSLECAFEVAGGSETGRHDLDSLSPTLQANSGAVLAVDYHHRCPSQHDVPDIRQILLVGDSSRVRSLS